MTPKTNFWLRPLALMVLVALLQGCLWENFAKTEKVNPQVLFSPTSAEALIETVSQATLQGKRIRMTGSGHSHSDVAVTDDILLTPYKLNQPLTLDRTRLKDPDDPLLARVQSGIRIRELNRYLDKQGLALQNMGGYDGQTIVGAAMTATHGSGLGYGPIASQILSLQVVGEGGVMYQIEPADGITDPATFPGTLEENPTIPVILIQDDTIFNSMVVSVGSMGIVYSVTLQTDRKFWLREVRTLTTWNAIKAPGGFLDRVLKGEPLEDSGEPLDYYELQYNPYPINGDHSILITKRFKSYEPLKTTGERGQAGTTLLSGLITFVEQPLSWLLNNIPALAPVLIEQSLKSQSDPGYNNVSYKIFNIGVVNNTNAIAVESAFDLEQTIPAMERAFSIAAELQAQGIVHSAPASVRFVKASDALIAMQYGRPSMILELIIVQGVRGDRDLLKTYEQTMMEEFHARPHWGLDLKILQGDDWARTLYPRWDDWLEVYRRFNSQGVFDGRVTDRLG
ncbi:MAG TPA: FAD-binding protein, partial [Dongiaceae bacterium]|nr:FAD-binding protein [Dongiaceae bacterium]